MNFTLDKNESEMINCLLEEDEEDVGQVDFLKTQSATSVSVENEKKIISNEILTCSKNSLSLQQAVITKPQQLRKLKVARLPRCDIRKQYFTAFLNILNSFDIGLLAKFGQHYCKRSSQFEQISSGKMVALPPDFHLLGIQPGVDYWKGIFISTPDACLRLSKIRVRERTDVKGSEIIAQVTLRGTTLYDLDLHDWLPSIKAPKTAQLCQGQVEVQLDLKQKKELLKKLKMGNARFSSLAKGDREIFCHEPKVLIDPKPVAIDYKINLFLDATDTLDKCVIECSNGMI